MPDENVGDSGFGRSLAETISHVLKSTFGLRVNLNKILSLANPEIKAWAKKLAVRAKEAVPEDSLLRSVIAERVFGWVSASIEDAGTKSPNKMVGDVLEKLSDFIETFVQEFCEKDASEVLKTSVEEATEGSETAKMLQKDRFVLLHEYRKRMAAARQEDKPAILAELRQAVEDQEQVAAILFPAPKRTRKRTTREESEPAGAGESRLEGAVEGAVGFAQGLFEGLTGKTNKRKRRSRR